MAVVVRFFLDQIPDEFRMPLNAHGKEFDLCLLQIFFKAFFRHFLHTNRNEKYLNEIPYICYMHLENFNVRMLKTVISCRCKRESVRIKNSLTGWFGIGFGCKSLKHFHFKWIICRTLLSYRKSSNFFLFTFQMRHFFLKPVRYSRENAFAVKCDESCLLIISIVVNLMNEE